MSQVGRQAGRDGRDRVVGATFAAVVAAALAMVMALPVVLAPTERIFGNAIVGRHHDPFTVMRQFGGAPVPAPFVQPATDWLGRALATVVHPVAAFNLVVLTSFPLAAWFGFLLGHHLTRSRLAATVTAFAFAFSPFHLAQSAYHPHIAQVHWIAFYLLAMWQCLHGFTPWRAAGLVLAVALVVLSNFYGGLIAIALGPIVLVAFWIGAPRGTWRDLAWTCGTIAAVGAAAVAVAWLTVPVLFDHLPAASRADLFRYSARWYAPWLPPVDHPVLGVASRAVWRRTAIDAGLLEQQIYLGLALVLLAVVAAAAWWRRRTIAAARVVPAIAIVAGAAYLFALPPESDVLGWRAQWPSAYLYGIAPMFRAYARFTAVTQLMVAIAAGIGAHVLWSSARPLARFCTGVLLAVAIFEYAPWAFRSQDVLPSSGHRWLADRQVTRVLDCAPSILAEQQTSWLAGYSIVHTGGGMPTCDEPDLAPRTRALGATHVIARPARPGWTSLSASTPQGLRQVFRGDDSAVFAVEPDAGDLFVASLAGWDALERDGARAWRWAGARATLTVQNAGAAPLSSIVALDLRSFHAPRHVTVSVSGRPVATLALDVHPMPYRVGPLLLAPGGTTLELQAVEPPVAPATVDPASADRRPLAVALEGWRFEPAP